MASGASAERVILSHHGAPCALPQLRALLHGLRSTRAARLKIVALGAALADAQVVRDVLAYAAGGRAPLACFALGAPGLATRILAPAWGSWATYGSAARGRETAQGQLLACELLEVHEVLRIGPDTRRFGLVGCPVTASPSPALHRAGYRAAGLDAVFLPLETESLDEVAAALAPGSALGLEALGVTIPLKEALARCSTPADRCAAAAGAVNTVLARTMPWAGHNTDGPAILACVRRRVDPRGLRVAIAGAGGTARAAGWMLRDAGATLTFFNRDLTRARRAAADLGGDAAPWEALACADWDILIQATPLGRGGEELPLARPLPGRLVLDAAYGAGPTPLVAHARACGLMVVDGHELLVTQALLQFALMTGRAPARREFDAALAQHVARGVDSARAADPS
jgi:3-dehydroquinate dehydratase/shikimate dehydrogenase